MPRTTWVDENWVIWVDTKLVDVLLHFLVQKTEESVNFSLYSGYFHYQNNSLAFALSTNSNMDWKSSKNTFIYGNRYFSMWLSRSYNLVSICQIFSKISSQSNLHSSTRWLCEKSKKKSLDQSFQAKYKRN